MKKHRGSKKKTSLRSAVLFGVVFSCLSIIAVSFFASLLVSRLDDPSGNLGHASLASLLIAGAISGFAVSKYKGDGGISASLISSLITVFIMLAAALIGKSGNVGGGIFMNYLCYLSLAALSAFLGRGREGRKKHKRTR